MKPKKSSVGVNSESSLKSRQRGDRSTEKFKSKSTSTHEDGSSTTIKDRQKSTTNNEGENRVRSRSVASIRDSEGKLLVKQVDKGSGKTRVRVTRRGSQAEYKKGGALKSRNYKKEYKKFQSSEKKKKYRAKLNKYNRDSGKYGNGDSLDASHKNGKIAGYEAEGKNRGRREKSRLRKKK